MVLIGETIGQALTQDRQKSSEDWLGWRSCNFGMILYGKANFKMRALTHPPTHTLQAEDRKSRGAGPHSLAVCPDARHIFAPPSVIFKVEKIVKLDSTCVT